MNHGQSNPGPSRWWATKLVVMMNLIGFVTTVASADVETEAWRNVVRALDPAEGTGRITPIENLARSRARGVAKVLVYLAENEPDPDIRGTAVLALVRLKDPTTEPALRGLRAKLGDPKPLVAQGELPKSQIYQSEDPQEGSRIFVIAALYRISREAGLREQLLALLRSRNLPQAMAAGAVLSFLREPAVLDTLYQTIPGADYLLACTIANHLLDEQNTPEVRRRLREAIKKRPVVGAPIQGQEIRESCIDGVLIRLAERGKG